MARDKDGNAVETYLKIRLFECKNDATDEELERIHQNFAKEDYFCIDSQFVTPISLDEYNQNNPEV